MSNSTRATPFAWASTGLIDGRLRVLASLELAPPFAGFIPLDLEALPGWGEMAIAPFFLYLGVVLGPGAGNETWRGPLARYAERGRTLGLGLSCDSILIFECLLQGAGKIVHLTLNGKLLLPFDAALTW